MRGPAEVVDVVEVDAGLDDPADVVDVPALAGRDRREPAEPVADGQVGVGRQQRLEHGHAAGHAGDQPRGVVAVVERVRVGPQRDQHLGDVDVVVGRGQQQRGPVVIVASLEVGAGPEGDRDGVGVAGAGGAQQGGVGVGGLRSAVVTVVRILSRRSKSAFAGHLQRGQSGRRRDRGQPDSRRRPAPARWWRTTGCPCRATRPRGSPGSRSG